MGNNASENRCVRIASSFSLVAVHDRLLLQGFRQNTEQVGQPEHMIEVRVRQKNVQPPSRQETIREVVGQAKHSASRIEHDAQLGQRETRRVPRVVRIVAAGAEQDELHGTTLSTRKKLYLIPARLLLTPAAGIW